MNIKVAESPNPQRIQLEMNNSFFKSSPANLKRQAIETLQARRRIKFKKNKNLNSQTSDNQNHQADISKQEKEQFDKKLQQFQEIDLQAYNINNGTMDIQKNKNESFLTDLAKFSAAHNHEKKKTFDLDAFPSIKKYIRQQATDISRIRNASPSFSSQPQSQNHQSRLKLILEEHSIHNQPNQLNLQNNKNDENFPSFPAINSPQQNEIALTTPKNSSIFTTQTITGNVIGQKIRSQSVQNQSKMQKTESSIQANYLHLNQGKYLDDLSKEYYINDENGTEIPSIDDFLKDKTKINFFKQTVKHKSRLSNMVLKLENDKIQINQLYKNDPYKKLLQNIPLTQKYQSKAPRRLLHYSNLESEMDRSSYLENDLSQTLLAQNISFLETFKNDKEKSEPTQTPNNLYSSSNDFFNNQVSEDQLKQMFSQNYKNIDFDQIIQAKQNNIDHSRIQFHYFAQNMIKIQKQKQNLNKNTQNVLNYQIWNRKDNMIQKIKLIDDQSQLLQDNGVDNNQLSTNSVSNFNQDSTKNLSTKKWFQTKKKLSKQFSQSIQINKIQSYQLNQFLIYLKEEYEKHIEENEKMFLKYIKQQLELGKIIDEKQMNDIIYNHLIDINSHFAQKSKQYILNEKPVFKQIHKNTAITEENEQDVDTNFEKPQNQSTKMKNQILQQNLQSQNSNYQRQMRYKRVGKELKKLNTGLSNYSIEEKKQQNQFQDGRITEESYFDPIITSYTLNTNQNLKTNLRNHTRINSFC
ncbi:hypothetical protein TTHERM_01079080 (macronuclear) [Tetrahymena thermophila SB210]|uniref:Uncharacterized protein n=1 Tax=Tetrahymena thermophila (strain SB210) TaxID=312017 RepID=Q24CE3_TETTS|nr:hypothetical protein TTHERM_01079080 [Tetrahymena thermophila SB210]EAS05431.2 hypothetical protein TTHERM_01079080 [Tetrahymena thermophila SB210]|eukprot:XP_001025676.2 hypothetical protein TTHERM_01079080 [Tetrahymena thermophila SB210]